MESTGARNRIHLSSDTAEILTAAGKGKLIERRKEQIDVKGKGPQFTYWVKIDSHASESANSGSIDGEAVDQVANAKFNDSTLTDGVATKKTLECRKLHSTKIARLVEWNVAVLTQRLEAIQLHRRRSGTIDLKVKEQLRRHVQGIAVKYRDNPFHNFEVCFC